MHEVKLYEGKLSFLNHVMAKGPEIYRSASWLYSSFSADQWEVRFAHLKHPHVIDFRVRMSDGNLLTDAEHLPLLTTFREWLCACTHPHATAARVLNSQTAQTRVHCTLHLVDYLLLRQEELDLCDHGLAGLTENDVLSLVANLASTNDVAESVYGWTSRVRKLLQDGIRTVSAWELAQARDEVPTIDFGLDRGGRLGLAPGDLLAARVWLWREGLYRKQARAKFKIRPNVLAIASRIYGGTLWGTQKRDIPPELLLQEYRLAERERKAVPVMDVSDERAGDRTVALYIRCLGHLKLLQRTGMAVPTHALDAIAKRSLHSWLQVKEVGRFQTLPQEVVLGAMRDSITFALKHGELLVRAYVAIASEARAQGCSIPEMENRRNLSELIPEQLVSLGVRSWRIPVGTKASGDYYERLRRNEGLCELLMILVGSTFVVTGAVTARRNGELTDLRVGACVDKNARHLVFENRKSGVAETRQREERPVPPLVVRLVRILEQLHSAGSKNVGSGALFAYPSRTTGELTDGTPNGVYFCVDLLCDYFELAGDSAETRYYIRQHQLRRFFAIAFFWGSGFGGLDTLRWFLGHTDPKHVWRYILESVPGKILASVRTQYAAQALLSGSVESDALADLIEQRFGTRQFSVLSMKELEEYIEVLLDNALLRVEPQFIDSDSGAAYRIAIVVTQHEVTHG